MPHSMPLVPSGRRAISHQESVPRTIAIYDPETPRFVASASTEVTSRIPCVLQASRTQRPGFGGVAHAAGERGHDVRTLAGPT